MMKETVMSGRAMCPYCGVGCHLQVTTYDNHISDARGDDTSPVNAGLVCPKGALVSPILELEGRLLRPRLRTVRGAVPQEVSWETTLAHTADRLRKIIDRYGAESVALYGSGQLDTEAWYLGNKLFKGYLGSNNVDSNSRLCMASAALAYRTMLGSDGPPVCYDDIEHADCYLVAGSNMADTHPVLFQRVKARRRADPKPALIVLDPRLSHTAQFADIHVPLKPGSDIAFFHAVARIAVERNAVDLEFVRQHTTGFKDYIALICSLDLNALADECGVPLDLIRNAADALIDAKTLLSFYCMGLGQSTVGTAKNQAIINLHLLLGQIGKIGAGPFSLTGQPNAMGGREVGGFATSLPGYRLIERDKDRHQVERYWGVPQGSIHPKNGSTAMEIFEGLESGRIKAVWIVCSNPIASLPNVERARRALENAELVILQDCFDNETVRYADVIFPAAQWIEKTGTMTNSERRVTRTHQLANPPGEAKPDWWIFSRMGQAMDFKGFDFEGVEAIWDEFRGLTRNTPCDQYGITNERLKRETVQWPCPDEQHPGTARRYLDHRFATPDGRARFASIKHRPPQEQPCKVYPLMLTTGRLASQWHTMTRTGKVQRLAKQAAAPYVEIHPQDAAIYGIVEGREVSVSSRRGAIRLEARISDRLKPGVVFIPMHWGDHYAPGGAVNTLTNDAYDPQSKQPEYKACAVAVSAG